MKYGRSLIDLANELERQLATKIDQIMLSSEDVAAKAPFAPIDITGGLLSDEAMALFAR